MLNKKLISLRTFLIDMTAIINSLKKYTPNCKKNYSISLLIKAMLRFKMKSYKKNWPKPDSNCKNKRTSNKILKRKIEKYQKVNLRLN